VSDEKYYILWVETFLDMSLFRIYETFSRNFRAAFPNEASVEAEVAAEHRTASARNRGINK
jgi:hypothetical protein